MLVLFVLSFVIYPVYNSACSMKYAIFFVFLLYVDVNKLLKCHGNLSYFCCPHFEDAMHEWVQVIISDVLIALLL